MVSSTSSEEELLESIQGSRKRKLPVVDKFSYKARANSKHRKRLSLLPYSNCVRRYLHSRAKRLKLSEVEETFSSDSICNDSETTSSDRQFENRGSTPRRLKKKSVSPNLRKIIKYDLVQLGKAEKAKEETPPIEEKDESSINSLPEEILLKIFSYLPLVSLIYKLPQVCRKWQTLAMDWTLWKGVEDLTVKSMIIDTTTLKSLLRTIPNLKKLKLISRYIKICLTAASFYQSATTSSQIWTMASVHQFIDIQDNNESIWDIICMLFGLLTPLLNIVVDLVKTIGLLCDTAWNVRFVVNFIGEFILDFIFMFAPIWEFVYDTLDRSETIWDFFCNTIWSTIGHFWENDTEEVLEELFEGNKTLEMLKLDRCYRSTLQMNILSHTITSILELCPNLKTVILNDTYFHSKSFYRSLANKFRMIDRINVTCTTKSEMDVFIETLVENIPEMEFQRVPMMGRADGKQIYWGPILGLVVRPMPTSPFHRRGGNEQYPNYTF